MGRIVSLSLSFLFLVGCPSYTRMLHGTMVNIAEERDQQTYFLAQSMYAGRFWDDDRSRLLSPRRFETLRYLQTLEGEPIYPPMPDDILPAGTRVLVEAVEFPSGIQVSRRPLYTPRYTTWVRIKVLGGTGVIDRRDAVPHVIVLPAFLEDKDSFDQWFDAFLTREDPRPWLETLERAQRRGVREKRAVVGMNYQTLTSAMGFPDQVKSSEGYEELWFGDHTRVELHDEKVAIVDESPKLQRPVPRGL